MILCWAAFTAILGCIRPVGCVLDTPGQSYILLQRMQTRTTRHAQPLQYVWGRFCLPAKCNEVGKSPSMEGGGGGVQLLSNQNKLCPEKKYKNRVSGEGVDKSKGKLRGKEWAEEGGF